MAYIDYTGIDALEVKFGIKSADRKRTPGCTPCARLVQDSQGWSAGE